MSGDLRVLEPIWKELRADSSISTTPTSGPSKSRSISARLARKGRMSAPSPCDWQEGSTRASCLTGPVGTGPLRQRWQCPALHASSGAEAKGTPPVVRSNIRPSSVPISRTARSCFAKSRLLMSIAAKRRPKRPKWRGRPRPNTSRKRISGRAWTSRCRPTHSIRPSRMITNRLTSLMPSTSPWATLTVTLPVSSWVQRISCHICTVSLASSCDNG